MNTRQEGEPRRSTTRRVVDRITSGITLGKQRRDENERKLFWEKVDKSDQKAGHTRDKREQYIRIDRATRYWFEHIRREDRQRVADLMEQVIERGQSNQDPTLKISIDDWAYYPGRRVSVSREVGDTEMEIIWWKKRQLGRDKYFINAYEAKGNVLDEEGRKVIYAVSIDEVTALYNKIFAIQ